MNQLVAELLKKYWATLSKKANVVGYDGELKPRIRAGKVYSEEPCFRIYVTRKVPLKELKPNDILPKTLKLDGRKIGYYSSSLEVSVDVFPVGVHIPLVKKIKIGDSGCHYLCSACTVGGYARSTLPNEEDIIGILANTHCAALSNKAKIGDAYLVPSPIDGGLYPRDKVATLYRFVPLEFSCGIRNIVSKLLPVFKKDKTNKVDIAFCAIDNLEYIDTRVKRIGRIRGKRIGELNETAHKYGRSSKYTRGAKLVSNDYYGEIYYGYQRGFFGPVGLLSGVDFAIPGDSSSLILWERDNFLAGNLFAGSNITTVFCHYYYVEELLHVEYYY